MSDVVVPVGSLTVHLDIACHWFLRWFEARPRFGVELLELHGILGDGAWWHSLAQYITCRPMGATVAPKVYKI